MFVSSPQSSSPKSSESGAGSFPKVDAAGAVDVEVPSSTADVPGVAAEGMLSLPSG